MRYLVVLSFLSLISCNRDLVTDEYDYIIFGHFYGECLGVDCVATYKLTSEKLFEDKKDSYRGSEGFDFEELSSEEFHKAAHLFGEVPIELKEEAEKTFGCPDCLDQGGLLLIVKGEEEKTWIIDQSLEDVPKYLHAYVEELNIVLNKLLN